MDYELKLEAYQGPLHKLLSLIEAKEMQITAISLGAVTEDFLAYLEKLRRQAAEGDPKAGSELRILVDFIVIASRLILLKSKSLLPDLEFSPAEEAGLAELETRLKLYQGLKPAMRQLQELWRQSHKQYGRGYFLHFSPSSTPPVFYPGTSITPEVLAQALSAIIEVLRKYEYETATIQEKVRSIEEEMQSVLNRLTSLKSATFSHLAADHTRSELIILFLALLHLARDQSISLKQDGHFSDIIVEQKLKM